MHMYARTDIGGRRVWRAHPMAELCGHGAVGAVGFSKPAFHALPPPTLIPLGVCVCVCVCVPTLILLGVSQRVRAVESTCAA